MLRQANACALSVVGGNPDDRFRSVESFDPGIKGSGPGVEYLGARFYPLVLLY